MAFLLTVVSRAFLLFIVFFAAEKGERQGRLSLTIAHALCAHYCTALFTTQLEGKSGMRGKKKEERTKGMCFHTCRTDILHTWHFTAHRVPGGCMYSAVWCA